MTGSGPAMRWLAEDQTWDCWQLNRYEMAGRRLDMKCLGVDQARDDWQQTRHGNAGS